ncbi:MAG TPA: SusC/RagA family TonB-linked outer membrane protein [Gemmatimonadales bacterium]
MQRHRLALCTLPAVLWLAPLAAQQPTGTVRGQVVVDDSAKQPLPGVTVSIGNRIAVTLADGRYVITGVPAGTDTIKARLIGYAAVKQAVTVGAGETVVADLAMSQQAVRLAEVLVSGYLQQRAGDATGAEKQVSDSDFNKGAIATPQMLIENKVSGVQVIDNNEPGGGLSIRIRGTSSVNASSEPLYVVDGMPLGTGSGGGLSAGRDPLNFLDPNDVETITVLKDAASTALYGANGSNGVVLITSKSGRGRPRVEYGGSFTAASVTRLPSMLNAAQFRAAVIQYDSATGFAQLGSANTNWFGLVDQTGLGQEHSIALAGAGENNSYRFSVGYLDQNGILKSSALQRISLGLNYDQRLYSDHLDLHASVRGSRQYDQFTPGGVLFNAAQMGPTQPVFDPASVTGFYNWPGNSLTSADNPVEVLRSAIDHGITYRALGNLAAKYDFSNFPALRGLTATAKVSFDVADVDRTTFYPNNIHIETKNGTNGSYFRTQPSQTTTQFEGILDYKPPVNLGPGTLDLTGAYSYQQSHSDFPSINATQLTTNLLGDAGIPQTVIPPVPSDFINDSKLISFLGAVGYNINDRYLFSASLRHDGSSRFGPGNRWGNFPGVSAAWRISQEPFMAPISAISDLKLRASYGKTGNQAFPDYLQFSTFQGCSATAEVQFGNTFICPFRPSAVDPNIKWESTGTWDVGADYAILGQTLTGAIDWYTKHTNNLIFNVPVAAGSNLSNFVTTNIGTMKNTGFEFDLTARILRGAPSGGLTWTSNFNLSHNVNELLSINPNAVGSSRVLTGGIAGGVGSTIEELAPGQPLNSFYVCRQAYAAGKPQENKYYNLAGDSVVTGCTRGTNTRAFHDPAPHWMFGYSQDMAYHHFDLSFTLRAWLGNYVYNNVASNLGDYRELYAGSSPYNLHSSVLKTGFTTQQLLSDYYVENGSFLRMDNIAVGYTFPWRGQSLRVYAVVQNAFTITGYSGVDPTAGLNGIDNNIYPRSRIFTGGLNVQF